MREYVSADRQVNWLKDFEDVEYTHMFKETDVTQADENGKKILKSGTIYPANNGTAIGIVFNDVDVTYGDVEGSLMVRGAVLEKRLPVTITAEAKTQLEKIGIHFYADNGETLS